MKKWIGGAKKHGGIFKSMEKQVDEWGKKAEKTIDDFSGVNKEEVIETQTSEIKTKEESVINPNAENLRTEILNYLNNDSVDKKVAEDISILIQNELLSNAEVASKALAYGNEALNSQVEKWVLNHINKNVPIKNLISTAALYYIEHTNEGDVANVIKETNNNTTDTSIEAFAEALFETNHPQLSADVALCLIGDTINGTTDDI